MILRTKIYNNNYYPIKIIKVDDRILQLSNDYKGQTYIEKDALVDKPKDRDELARDRSKEDGVKVSYVIGVIEKTFDPDRGLLIKPFQTEE
jgi:hypothetical protein